MEVYSAPNTTFPLTESAPVFVFRKSIFSTSCRTYLLYEPSKRSTIKLLLIIMLGKKGLKIEWTINSLDERRNHSSLNLSYYCQPRFYFRERKQYGEPVVTHPNANFKKKGALQGMLIFFVIATSKPCIIVTNFC